MPQLHQAIESIARNTPAMPAVFHPGGVLDFAALAALVRRAAAALHRAGLAPGDMVGLSVREELPRLALQLGLMRLGCASVTLASFEPLETRATLARRCGAVAVVCDHDLAHPDGLSVIHPDLAALQNDPGLEAAGRALAQPDGAATAIVLTSSGTTGMPKLIRRTQAQLLAYRQAEWPVRTRGVANMASPAESNAWTWTSLCNLGRGNAVAFLDPSQGSFLALCAASAITKTSVWPAHLRALAAQCRTADGPSPLRDVCVLTGGSGVEPALQREVLADLTPHLVVQYGGTEVGNVTWLRADPDRYPPEAVGYALPGCEVAIVDDAGRRLPTGQTGLVRIRSLWVATEYWQDEAASARAFIDGWWQPGDLGRLDAEGLLSFAGRADDMMVMNSINVFPLEIERVAAGFPGVIECAAFPLASARYGQLPMLAVVAAPQLDLDALNAHCREQLGVRAPRKIIRVDRLPRNPTGKVLRKELADLLPAQT